MVVFYYIGNEGRSITHPANGFKTVMNPGWNVVSLERDDEGNWTEKSEEWVKLQLKGKPDQFSEVQDRVKWELNGRDMSLNGEPSRKMGVMNRKENMLESARGHLANLKTLGIEIPSTLKELEKSIPVKPVDDESVVAKAKRLSMDTGAAGVPTEKIGEVLPGKLKKTT